VSVSVEQQLRAGLLAQSGVTNIIGDNLFLVQLPQNPTYPSAAYQRIATVPLYTQENTNQGTVGYVRFQITGFFQGASSGQQSEAFAQAVTAALQTFNCAQGVPASPPLLGTPPNYVLGRRMLVQPQTQPPIFMCVIDAKLWYNDAN
jgi:hypothetical protein